MKFERGECLPRAFRPLATVSKTMSRLCACSMKHVHWHMENHDYRDLEARLLLWFVSNCGGKRKEASALPQGPWVMRSPEAFKQNSPVGQVNGLSPGVESSRTDSDPCWSVPVACENDGFPVDILFTGCPGAGFFLGEGLEDDKLRMQRLRAYTEVPAAPCGIIVRDVKVGIYGRGGFGVLHSSCWEGPLLFGFQQTANTMLKQDQTSGGYSVKRFFSFSVA